MAGHTPGPWQTRDDMTPDGRCTIIADVDGEYVDGVPHCTFKTVAVCEDEYGERLVNAVHNARLIAAAPDLLEALQDLEPFLDAIVCYASSMDEHEPNRLAFNARVILNRLAGLGEANGSPIAKTEGSQ